MNLDNLYKEINNRGLTLKKVSEETGVAITVLSDWKNGKAVPTVARLECVADYLDCSIDYLIGRNDKFMKLPCKVGDTLYTIYNDNDVFMIETPKINEISNKRVWIGCFNQCFELSEIGKTLFFTQKQAEQALQEMRKSQ